MTAYNNDLSDDDIESELAAAETYESELSVEAPPLNKAAFYSQDELFIEDELTERRVPNMPEIKRTLSDAAIIRELEATRSYMDEQISGLEEVNKLWFHTISQQLNDTNKLLKREVNDAILCDIADLLAPILDNQERILKQSDDNYSKLKSDTEKLLADRYENNVSNDATRNTIRGEIATINKRIKSLRYLLIAVIAIVFIALSCR